MYICCLSLDQEEYEQMPPLKRWLYTWWTGSKVYHVQVAFDEYNPQTRRMDVRTFSTDIGHNGVFSELNKQYNRRWWHFYRVSAATAQQVDAAYAFCVEKEREHAAFNERGADCAVAFGYSGMGKSFFCSELVATCMICANLISASEKPEFYTPATIDQLCRSSPARYELWPHLGVLEKKLNELYATQAQQQAHAALAVAPMY